MATSLFAAHRVRQALNTVSRTSALRRQRGSGIVVMGVLYKLAMTVMQIRSPSFRSFKGKSRDAKQHNAHGTTTHARDDTYISPEEFAIIV